MNHRDPNNWRPMWIWYHTALLIALIVCDALLVVALVRGWG